MDSSETKFAFSVDEEPDDDFYEFTAEDYFRTMSARTKDQSLKTRKIREAESAARRARITKAVIRVKFPDKYVLEATFHPSETIQSLIDLLLKAVAQPQLPFYLYTTPPKMRIKDTSMDLYTAGFIPGAIVYFSLDLPEGGADVEKSGPFLRDDVLSLESTVDRVTPGQEALVEKEDGGDGDKDVPIDGSVAEAATSGEKKTTKTKPKWFKM
ncbi:plant UBX domain-containing protein 1 isoform X2 [Wolffia australiana]